MVDLVSLRMFLRNRAKHGGFNELIVRTNESLIGIESKRRYRVEQERARGLTALLAGKNRLARSGIVHKFNCHTDLMAH